MELELLLYDLSRLEPADLSFLDSFSDVTFPKPVSQI